MIARIRYNEYREAYTNKLRWSWISERYDPNTRTWEFIACEKSTIVARQKIEEWCDFRHIERPKFIDKVR